MLMAETVDLEEQVSFLELENEFLRNFLAARNAAVSTDGDAAATDDWRDPLLLAEKLELCAVEGNTTRREIEQMQKDSELELACTLAAITDCRQQQAAETSRDVAALLGLLGLTADRASAPLPVLTPDAGAEQATASCSSSADPQGEPTVVGLAPPAPVPDPALALPTATQLAKAELAGPRLEEFLEGILARHEAAATRLQARNAMLQVSACGRWKRLGPVCTDVVPCAAGARPCVHAHLTLARRCLRPLQSQLGRVEGQLAAKAAAGGPTLRKVDFEQLRIERAQAEAEVAAASAGAIALKAQVARAQQHLADQRSLLVAAAAAAAQLQRQIEVREGQAAQLLAGAAKVRRECGELERECQRLQGQGKGQAPPAATPGDDAGVTAAPAGGDAEEEAPGSVATILDYMRVKNACAEVSKKIADWQRKLEVHAGQRR